ncbi:SURF1 family cytochrome oxidase biogenesis protein [Amnibacterium endophyticum]|uniref:SURF1-like protein n=1 Tax=Amnibacterium endophyticum TaxID=2109337 RepID=A0ABW4LD66_9MICO
MTDDVAADRTLAREYLTPRSLGLLVVFLLLAGVFAGLMQWQLSRAVDRGVVERRATEQVVSLSSVARPDAQQTDASVGQSVSAEGRLVPQDTFVVGDRLNRGQRGWWVVGHAALDDGSQLALGLGWAPTEEAARRAADEVRAAPAEPRDFVGRYVDSDGAEPTASGDPRALVGVSTARLVNLWTLPADAPVYEGVMTLRQAPAGLTAIWSPKPGEQVELNLLNVLYAVEWALFAVFALYIWYRLVRDRWEARQQPVDEDERVPVDA